MTRNEAVQEIQDGLGYTSLHFDRIVRQLKNAQERLENGPVRPWFLLNERAYTNTVINERRIALPTDFLEEAEEGALWYVPNPTTAPFVETELIKDDLDFLTKNSVTNVGSSDNEDWEAETGEPKFYALSGNYLYIFPTPDAVYRLRMVYFHSDTILDSNVENDWLKYAPWLLIGEAGVVMAANSRDKDALAKFQNYRSQGIITLDVENQSRMHTNRNYVMGDGAL